ncbi:hypothetical protein BGX24_009181 [Mortierella sp. AD032]|nr:hypothetical protein BGX24_009181 [Mortierella sp. AD032]
MLVSSASNETMELEHLEYSYPLGVAQAIDIGVALITHVTFEIESIFNNETNTVGVDGKLYANKIRFAYIAHDTTSTI